MPLSSLVSAFYILFANQVNDNSGFPHKICQNNGFGPQGGECVDLTNYTNGVIILSPQNVTSLDVAKIKAAVPGSVVLAYWDFGDIPWMNSSASNDTLCPCCTGHVMGDLSGRNCSTTYACGAGTFTDALAAVIPASTFVARLDETPFKRVLQCGYPGLPSYIHSAESTPILTSFLGSWLPDHGFDGIYLDGYEVPGTKVINFPGEIDYDGDGIAESTADALKQYAAWAPAFVAGLRSALGPEAIILANAAGPNSDPSLNGLTIEMEACEDPLGWVG
jgi:hypothetical protein